MGSPSPSDGRLRARSKRGERAALLAMWLVGMAALAFFAVPSLHAIGHHGDHVHIGGATVALADTPAGDPAQPAGSPADAPRPEDAGHGDGSLAHLGAAWLTPATIAAPAPLVLVQELDAPAVNAAPARATRRVYDARGPPA